MDRVWFSIRIDRDLNEAVKRKAVEEDRTVSSLVRAALRRYTTSGETR